MSGSSTQVLSAGDAAPARLLCDEPALPGLLWAMRFDGTGRGRVLGPDEPPLQAGQFGDGFVWLHFNLNDARVAALVAEGRLGPARLAADAFAADEHQRLTVEGGHVGGVVADLVHGTDPQAHPDAAGRLHFVLGPRLLASGRRHPVAGPDRIRESTAGGQQEIAAPVLLLESAVAHVVGAMAATGRRLADELDGIEDHILEERVHGARRRLGPIRRESVRLHRQLLGLRAVFHRLEAEGDALQPEAIAAAARLAQRLDALDRDMVALADRSRLLQEELSGALAVASGRQLYTLSILTALFLPPTLVTGLFGMNTKGLPFSDFDDGSVLAIGLALLSAAGAFVLIRALGIRPPRD